MESPVGSGDLPPQADASAGPTASAIQSALRRLGSRGAAPYWVRQKCPVLLELRGVRSRLESVDRPTREEATAALVDYLKTDAIARLDDEEDRIVLEVVLGLKDEYLEYRRAPERHALAGTLCRGGQDPLSGNTIRQREFPNALKKLLAIVLEDQGLWPNGGSEGSRNAT